MTITFPPYFLLFGLPKWVATEAVPFIFTQMVVLLKFVKKKVQTPAQAFANKMASLLVWSKNMGRNLISRLLD